MIYLIFILPLIAYAYFSPKFIRKYRYIHYILAAIIAVIAASLESHNFITDGFLGLSFFIIVMFTATLSQSTIKKRLNTVRGVYSIIAFILISSHAISYLLFVLEEGLFLSSWVIPIGLIVYLTFLPLFITSFTEIRKHIPYRQWKNIHNYAYFGYAFLFLHLYLLDNSRSIYYLGLFSIYLIFRLIQYIDKMLAKKKVEKIKAEKIDNQLKSNDS